MGVIRVLVADDQKLVRQCLRRLINGTAGLTVIAEAADGREAVSLAAELLPDVVLMDIEMPGLNGMEATRQIVARTPGVKVIAVTGYADARRTAQMFEAGASAYFTKMGAFVELLRALRAVVAGRKYVSPQVADHLVSGFVSAARGEARSPASPRLSPREREVLQLVAEGKSTKQIAAILHVSIKTVETHRRSLMEKLALESVAQLTKFAVREGLTGLDD